MKNFTTLCVLLFSLLQFSYTQDKPFRSLSFEAGADFISCLPPDDKSYIRAENVPYSYYYESASYVMALLYKNYYGIKYERRALNNKLGLLGGIRYSRADASIGKETYWTESKDYFYVLYNQEGSNTEYLRVNHISQISHYLGIPLEFRIYPYEERKIQLYYKIGLDINFLMGSNTRVIFENPDMGIYESEMKNVIEDPWKSYATACLAIGLKIGDSSKPGINIEACVPSGILRSSRNSFIEPAGGAGIQFNIRFPF